MQKVIYLDSVFFTNFMMDFLLLLLTARMLKKPFSWHKALAGSITGALGYCLVLCLPGLYFLKVVCGFIPVTALMVKIGCGTKTVSELLYGVGALFTCSFFTGGLMLFVIKKLPFAKNSMGAVLFAGGLAYLVCRLVIDSYKKGKRNHFCRVELPGDEETLVVCGLIDTGNGLHDPVSGKEAAILEEAVWQKMQQCKRPEKYKIIPFHSIGKENGILEGYEVDKIRIEEKARMIDLENVVIAVFKGKLSAKESYQIILPPQWF